MGGGCTKVFLFSSGCQNDTSVTDNISDVQSIVSNALSTSKTTSFLSVEAANNLTITIGPYGVISCAGGFNVFQTVSGNYQVYTNIAQTQLDQIIQDMSTYISTSISNASSDIEGFLSAATNNKTTAQITTELTNAIQTSLTLSVVNSIISSFNFNNNLNINVQGHLISDAACTINQDIFITLCVSTIVQVIQNAVISQQDMVNLQQLLTNSSQTVTKGPLDSYTDTSNASLQWVFVIAIVIVIVALIGLMSYFIAASLNCRKKIDKALKQQKALENKKATNTNNNTAVTTSSTSAFASPTPSTQTQTTTTVSNPQTPTVQTQTVAQTQRANPRTSNPTPQSSKQTVSTSSIQ